MNKKQEERDIRIGDRIRNARLNAGYTQKQIAEKLCVSEQAVSLWERGNLPTIDNIVELADLLGVSLSSLLEDRDESLSKSKMAIFDYKKMYTFVKSKANALGLNQTVKALTFANSAHEGQYRKINTKLKKNETLVPYIYHPLSLACNALAMGIADDDIISAALLHDVLEDCVMVYSGVYKDEIHSKAFIKANPDPIMKTRPLDKEDLVGFSQRVKDIVEKLTHVEENGKDRDKVMKKYFDTISKDPQASLIKCLDRCNNLGTMSWGLSRERMIRQIVETEKYFPKLIESIKDEPEYNNAAFLLSSQIRTLLDVYKRLL